MYCVTLTPGLETMQVGAKAANLGRALALGLRVPAAFVVTRKALSLFLAESGLLAHVRAYLADVHGRGRAERGQSFEELCQAVHSAPIPGILQRQIGRLAESLLGAAPNGLAVRSSAVHEDSQKASFAGVYESYLGVVSNKSLWPSIRGCWCSSWAPRAIDYANKMGVDLEPDQMAVIVQETVPATSAGVIWTADPVTGNPWRFVLNATFGLAQGLVGGAMAADRLVLEWDTGEVVERSTAEKRRAILPGPTGVREIELDADQWAAPALTDDTARKVSEMALALDRAFGRRVDVEWAVADQDVYLIQVRPVTALPRFFPHQPTASDAELTWMLSDPAWYHTVREGERVVAPLFRDRWASELWLRHQPTADKALPRPVWRELDVNGYRYATPWVWGGPWQDLERTEKWLDETEASMRHDWLECVQDMRQACAEAEERQHSAWRAAHLIPILLALYEREVDMNAAVWAAPQSLGWVCEGLLRNLLKGTAFAQPTESLLQGLPCYSFERAMAARDLAYSAGPEVRTVFAEKPLAEVISFLRSCLPEHPFLREYERFCYRFGMWPPTWPKEWARWSLEPPAGWGQNPTLTVAAIRNAMLGKGRDAGAVLEECALRRRAAEAQLLACIGQEDALLLQRVRKVLTWTQFWVPTLDDRKWHLVARTRLADLILQIGTMLAEEGLVDEPNDLLLFTTDDLLQVAKAHSASAYRGLYETRKRARAQPPSEPSRVPGQAAVSASGAGHRVRIPGRWRATGSGEPHSERASVLTGTGSWNIAEGSSGQPRPVSGFAWGRAYRRLPWHPDVGNRLAVVALGSQGTRNGGGRPVAARNADRTRVWRAVHQRDDGRLG